MLRLIPMSEASAARIVPVRPKPLSVGEFNRAVKTAVEEKFTGIWIEGEIVQCKIAASGHAYFDLKDDQEDARVSCCLFKNAMTRAKASVRDGERVLLRAKGSIYPARGSFQLIVDTLLPAGAGNAAAALEALKRKLAAEGLFAPERKRKLPRFPRAIGVVTSQHGAAFADICRVAHRRWPVRIVVANTLVQGAEAVVKIVSALNAIQRVNDIDVIIIGRGGGASDDLSVFNDERVARAIAACKIPVISAVGHEVDHTVADLVADVRAATPSNAAEMCVPERSVVEQEIHSAAARLIAAVKAQVNTRRVKLSRLEKRMGDPRRFTDEAKQRLDDALERLANAARKRVTKQRKTATTLATRLSAAHPQTRLANHRAKLQVLSQRLQPALAKMIDQRRRTLENAESSLIASTKAMLVDRRAGLGKRVAQLSALSPLAILARGYSVVLAEGKAVTNSAQVTPGEKIHVRLHQGELAATVTEILDRKPQE